MVKLPIVVYLITVVNGRDARSTLLVTRGQSRSSICVFSLCPTAAIVFTKSAFRPGTAYERKTRSLRAKPNKRKKVCLLKLYASKGSLFTWFRFKSTKLINY